jgi:hypothetical protein
MLQDMQRSTIAIPRLSRPAALLLSLGVTGIVAWALYGMGRPLICTCGFRLWHGGVRDAEVSQHLFDWYTSSHILHGMILYWLLSIIARGRLSVAARLVVASLIEGAWELSANSVSALDFYRAHTAAKGYAGDTIVNSVGDMLAMPVGFLLAARLPTWVSVLLLIGVEAGLLWLTRDNLLINLITLVQLLGATGMLQGR